MIVTIIPFAEHRLLLIAGYISESSNSSASDKQTDREMSQDLKSRLDLVPKLLSVDWLADKEDWQQSKSLLPIKRHFHLNNDDFQFVAENSLSKQNPVESLLLSTISQLKDYQMGNLRQFDIELDISIGTEFQQKVWQALQQIKYAQTISYAQLANHIGKPTAYRAVANANGKNPFSIIIPCHRVVASDGSLGGYTGGLDKKRLLLQIEQQR